MLQVVKIPFLPFLLIAKCSRDEIMFSRETTVKGNIKLHKLPEIFHI